MTTGLVTRPIVSVTTGGATTPIIANVTCTLANTEYSYVLPTGCQTFTINPRAISGGPLKLAYVAGQSGTNYIFIPQNSFRSVGDLSITNPVSLYFQSSKAGTIVEIELWT